MPVAPEDLLRQADVAMYAAKHLGKGRAEMFRSDMHARATRQAELGPRLRRALRDHEFRLHFQPVVDLGSGRITGVEALVRWQHPERGLLPPAEFLDVAEQSDLVIELGRWVLAEACRWSATWQELLGPGALIVHVNVSARRLGCSTFLADVQTAVAASGCSARRLVLELTETHLLTVGASVHQDGPGAAADGAGAGGGRRRRRDARARGRADPAADTAVGALSTHGHAGSGRRPSGAPARTCVVPWGE